MMRLLRIAAVAAVLGVLRGAGAWSLESTPLWADFGSNGVPDAPCAGSDCMLSPAQIAFVARTYQIVSLEKCFGMKWGAGANLTEDNFITTTRQLKAANASVQVLFYWNVPLVIGECYTSAAPFLNHTDWWLKDDQGKVIHVDGNPSHLLVDFTVPAAAQWWASVPLRMVAEAGADGLFLDGTAGQDYTGWGVSQARSDRINQLAVQAMVALRSALKAAQPAALVIGNGLTEYAFPPDHGLSTLAFLDGVCLEHFGAFEGVDDTNGSVIPQQLLLWASLIRQVVERGKLVLVKAWVGPETLPLDGWGPSWPAAHRPPLNRTHTGIAQAAADNVVFAQAVFLCMVDKGVYFSYAWWYDVLQGYVPCRANPGTCDTPPDFFPTFVRRIGDPLQPAAASWTGVVCRREFAGASVFANLSNPATASIAWKAP